MFRQVIAALVLAACLFFGAPAGTREAGAEILPAALPALAPGDLLFKGADTGVGTQLAVAWSLGDKRWGHVGIVVASPAGGLAVIHADTGARREIGHVRRVSLGEYLSDVSDLGVYSIDLQGQARTDFLAYAESAVGRPFDKAFSLESENSLYCSELVWRAMSEALGEDAIPEKSERLGRIYISVSDLADHPRVQERAVIKAAAATASH